MRKRLHELAVLSLGVALFLSGAVPFAKRVLAQEGGARYQINTTNAQPRELEEATQKAIAREYSNAWKNMASALRDNNADPLNQSFIGTARDQMFSRVEQQRGSGTTSNITDKSHKIDVLFYSPEGSAIQLRDTAEYELQVLEGGKVIYTEQVTQNYIAILTVGEGSWKVRVLQEVKSF